MVGASRQWVTMTLDRFQDQGIIRVGKRRTVILRPDVLRTPPFGRAKASGRIDRLASADRHGAWRPCSLSGS